jgi:hypothetical protein
MLRRSTVLWVVALVVVVVVGVVVVGYASATTMTLPTFSVQQSFTGSSGAGVLTSSGFTLKCTSDADQGTMESNRNLGLFTIEFKTCSTSLTTGTCRSLGLAASSSTILVSGSWHLVLETLSSGDMHYILFLLNPLHIECGTTEPVLLQVRGNVLGLIVAGASEKEYLLTVNSGDTTTQEYTSFENNNGTLVETKLEAAANLGFHVSGETSAENKMFASAKSVIEN